MTTPDTQAPTARTGTDAGTDSGAHDPITVGIVSISDRASSGVYEDKGLPALQAWLTRALKNPITLEARLIPDDQAAISAALVELVDTARCCLVLTTGGTGPALRDVTPEATLAIAHKEMPGFGEQMRQISLNFCAHGHPVASGGGGSAQQPRHQPAGSTQSRLPRRWKACAVTTAAPRCPASLRPCRTAST